MSKALQPYNSFPIEKNRVNFYSNRFSSIDSMLTGDNLELAMLSGM